MGISSHRIQLRKQLTDLRINVFLRECQQWKFPIG